MAKTSTPQWPGWIYSGGTSIPPPPNPPTKK